MRILGVLAALSLCALAHPHHAAAERMAETAKRFLASLTDEQKAKTVVAFDNEDERTFWHYIPSDDIPKRYGKPRGGLTLREMSPEQKHLASSLLSAGLSQQGYIKATTIMSLEDILRILEGDKVNRRDPDKYHFTIFGEPAVKGVWAYRVEGHHVSLHYTVVNGKAVGNPTFFGSNPAEVRQGPRKGLRVLAAEEDRARALLESLTADQKKAAIVSATAYPDILTEQTRKAALKGQPSGLPESKMNAPQKQLLAELIAEYVDNVPGELAEQRRERVKQSQGKMWFAWAGVEERGGPHYYRVQTPHFLIEYDNTQNGANHIHSVWRDFESDFGMDLLKAHYATSPKNHGHNPASSK